MLLDKNKPFYSVVQVAEILGMSSDRLRTYDEEGLVCPARQNGKKRLYCELDIEWLQDVRKIISKNKMNIYSFKLVLKMLNFMPEKEISRLKNKDEIWEIFARLKDNPNFKKLQS